MDEGVSPLQLAAAYVPFANRGIYNTPTTYTRVEDQFGHVILDKRTSSPVLVYDERAAYLMNSIMQDVTTHGTAADVGELAGLSGELIRTAGKSGTTEDGRDHWFVGMTPYYTAANWYGYDNNAPVPYGAEWVQSSKIWKCVMAEVSKTMRGKDFTVPYGLVQRTVGDRPGGLPEYFIKGTEPVYVPPAASSTAPPATTNPPAAVPGT
jgi:penicillin-binding protein 1A